MVALSRPSGPAGLVFLLCAGALLPVPLLAQKKPPRNAQVATTSKRAVEAWLEAHPAGASQALTLPDESGNRLTHWAASGGQLEVLQLLKSKGADPWDGTGTAEEQSAFHFACQSGHMEIIEWMLTEDVLAFRSRGAITVQEAVTKPDKKGTSPLHMATSTGHVSVIKALVEAKADVQASNFKSGTALHMAAFIGQTGAAKALLDLGADPCEQNERGETPGDRAREEENEQIVTILEEEERSKGCAPKSKKDEKAEKKADKEAKKAAKEAKKAAKKSKKGSKEL